jgi:hydrogenase maturation protease
MTRRVLVAGIGNMLLCDDGFGVAVAERLAGYSLPEEVRVADFGIRGVHLAYELLNGYDVLVLIDAVPLGEPPGTLAIIEPDLGPGPDGDDETIVMDAHRMSPEIVLGTLTSLGGSVDQVFIVGCQPADLSDGIGLSAPVQASVEPAAEMCRQLVEEIAELAGKETGR